jgi:hypothetical protein
VKEYGVVGAMTNGSTVAEDPTLGLYLDDKQYDALRAVPKRLQKPILTHPRVSRSSNLKMLEGIPILHGTPYGFAQRLLSIC